MSEDPKDRARKLAGIMSQGTEDAGRLMHANIVARHVMALFEAKPEISIEDVIAALENESCESTRRAEFNRVAIERLRELQAAHRSTG